MLLRCRRHVLGLRHLHSNSINQAANVCEGLRMPECIYILVARSSVSLRSSIRTPSARSRRNKTKQIGGRRHVHSKSNFVREVASLSFCLWHAFMCLVTVVWFYRNVRLYVGVRSRVLMQQSDWALSTSTCQHLSFQHQARKQVTAPVRGVPMREACSDAEATQHQISVASTFRSQPTPPPSHP